MGGREGLPSKPQDVFDFICELKTLSLAGFKQPAQDDAGLRQDLARCCPATFSLKQCVCDIRLPRLGQSTPKRLALFVVVPDRRTSVPTALNNRNLQQVARARPPDAETAAGRGRWPCQQAHGRLEP